MTPLDEICELVRGVTYRKGDEVRERGLQVLRANNINRDTHSLNLTEIKNVSCALKFPDAKKLKRHDILICLASGSQSHIGKVALSLNDTEYYFGGFMGAVRANSSLVDPHFLYFQLRQTNFNDFLRQQISGANINNLSAKLLYRFQIPLPPLEVQKEIVAEIEGYQKVIDGARAVVENYRPHIHVDPDWPMVELGGLCAVVRGSSPRPKRDSRYYGGPIPRLMVADISRDGMYSTPQIDSLTVEGAEKSRPMKKGDVVIAVSGNPGLPTVLSVDACIHDGFVGLREVSENVNNEYLYWNLLSQHERNAMQSVGAIFKNLTTSQVKEFEVPLPPLETQRAIVAEIEAEQTIVNANRELIERFNKKIEKIIAGVWNE